ncbi:MAG: ACP S-malonyltransferase [candidate division Zixibacteria bacterium]|nr:ACP S-malonyltransferase [candidate division Zixibacteria bacterium]
MDKIAFLFPGQGAQYVGMAQDLYESHAGVKELYSAAERVLGFDLAKICFEGPAEVLVQTQHTQPAIFTHSVTLWTLLRDHGLKPAFVAGHSVGEYSALVAAGALSFEDALQTVKNRSLLMQQACDSSQGSMAAIIGLTEKDILSICREAASYGVIQLANFNSKDQIAISGERRAVEKGVELAEERGARRAILLEVAGAFHSELMRPAQEKFGQVIGKLEVKQPEIPMVANVTAEPVTDPSHIKELLTDQITMPVLWYQSMVRMYKEGIRTFVEVGPGRVLQGLLKRSFKDTRGVGVERLPDLEKLVEAAKVGTI